MELCLYRGGATERPLSPRGLRPGGGQGEREVGRTGRRSDARAIHQLQDLRSDPPEPPTHRCGASTESTTAMGHRPAPRAVAAVVVQLLPSCQLAREARIPDQMAEGRSRSRDREEPFHHDKNDVAGEWALEVPSAEVAASEISAASKVSSAPAPAEVSARLGTATAAIAVPATPTEGAHAPTTEHRTEQHAFE